MEHSDGTGEPGSGENSNARSERISSGGSEIDGAGDPGDCAGDSDNNVGYRSNSGGGGESSDRDNESTLYTDESGVGASSENSAGRRVDSMDNDEDPECGEGESVSNESEVAQEDAFRKEAEDEC